MSGEDNNQVAKKIYDFNTLIPFVLCKLSACGTILINMQWSKNQQVQLVGMGIGTIFSFVFGYLVIISLNIGLNYEISRKKDKATQIGIYYQRALLINYIICAFLVTPILYISRRIIVLFDNVVDNELSNVISQYLFQLVPSIFCFAFYDTTQTYLLAQQVYLAPLVINIISVFAHFFLIQYFGAAWSKNFTDIGCCIAIYLYIVLKKRKLESWIEWTIKCIQGWSNHMRFLQIIGLTTYLQSFFFFIFAILAYKLQEKAQLVCHICFLNLYQILFLLIIGLKEGLMSKLGIQIKNKKIRMSKRLGISTIKLFLIATFIFVFLILIYSDEIANFFLISQKSRQIFKQNIWILLLVLIVDALKSGLNTLLKAVNQNYALAKINLFFLILGFLLGYLICYKLKYGLIGIWQGWLISCSIHVISNWMMLANAQKKAHKQVTI